MSLFDLTANNNYRKIMVLDSKYPENVTVKQGTDAVFSAVIAEDGRPTEYTYQWYVNGSAVSGATNAIYTRKTTSDKGVYSVYCEITNKAGTVKTRTATLTVNKVPTLNSTLPADATINVGESKTIEVSIATHGYPQTYTYQWYKNGSKISGATSNKYTFVPAEVGNVSFYCEVKNSAGTVKSRTATFKQILYLYKAGNECTANTGGWISTSLKYDNSDGVYQPATAPTKNASNMVFIAQSTAAGKFDGTYAKNKINLTNGTYLKAEITVDSLDWDDKSRWSIRALTGMNY